MRRFWMTSLAVVVVAGIGAGAWAGVRYVLHKPAEPKPADRVLESQTTTGGAHFGGVACCAFNGDATRLATGSWDGTVWIWSVPERRTVVRLHGPVNGGPGAAETERYNATVVVAGLDWSPDGTRVAGAAWDNTVRIWKVEGGKEIHVLRGHTNGVNAVDWSASGDRIASAGCDGTVRIWNAADGTLLRTIDAHSRWVLGVAWDAAGKRVASAGRDGRVHLWDAADGKLIRSWGSEADPLHDGQVRRVAWLGDKLITAGDDGRVAMRPTTGDGPDIGWRVARDFVSDLAVVQSDALAGEPLILTCSDEKVIRLWHADGRPSAVGKGHSGPLRCCAASPDGRLLASGGWDNMVRIWNVTAKQ